MDDLFSLFEKKGPDTTAEDVQQILDACVDSWPKERLVTEQQDDGQDYEFTPLQFALKYGAPADAVKRVLQVSGSVHGWALHAGTGVLAGTDKLAPADSMLATFAALPAAALTKDPQNGATPIFKICQHIYYYRELYHTGNIPPGYSALLRTMLRYGCQDKNFDPTELKQLYFAAEDYDSEDDGYDTPDPDPDFADSPRSDLLLELLQTQPKDLSELFKEVNNPGFKPPSPFHPAELCKGWTPLKIAANEGTAGSFFWLLKKYEKDRTFLFGDPTQCDEIAVTAARASPDETIREWGTKYGRLLEKYKIDSSEAPKHVSPTCVVVFASEFDETTGKDVAVALKFMGDEAAFQREIDNREKILTQRSASSTNSKLLIGIVRSHNDLQPADLNPFPHIKLSSSSSSSSDSTKASAAQPRKPLKYLLVLDKGSADLSDIISHSNMAGKDRHDALGSAIKVAKCIQYLNEGCSVMHGDVKSRNFVELGGGNGMASIDLDAAAVIKRGSFAGQKVTSSGCLPPEQAAIVLYNRQLEDERKKKAAAKPKQIESDREAELSALKRKRTQAQDADQDEEADRITAEIKELKAKIAGGSSTLAAEAPPPVDASHAYDMWGFGVLLYQLCTGLNLFDIDVREEVIDNDELARIADWSDDSRAKKVKMSRIGTGWPKRLVEQLLSRDPADRPATWSDVITELEATSSGDAGVLAAIADLKTTVKAGFKENKDLHAKMLNTMKAEFDATRKFMVEMEKIDHPYVFEVLTPDDVAKEKADEAAEEAAAFVTDTALVKDLDATAQKDIKKFHKKISRIKRFYNRSKETYDRLKGIAVSVGDFAGDPTFEAAGNVVKSTKKGKTFKLRLLCGITFEPIIEYEFDESEYGPKMKKLAKVGSTIAQGAVMLASIVNPISSVAGFFGYPIPKIPVDKIEGVKGFLDDIQTKDTSEKFAGMKKAQDGDGLNLKAMGKLKAMIEKLEKEKCGRDCRPPPTDEREMDAYENDPFYWKSGLTKCQDPKNPGMVTFMDARLYPKHGGKEGGTSWVKVGEDAPAANADGFGFGDDSEDIDDSDIDIDAASVQSSSGFGGNEQENFGGFNGEDATRETGGSSLPPPQKSGAARPRNGVRDDVQAQILDEIKELRRQQQQHQKEQQQQQQQQQQLSTQLLAKRSKCVMM